MSETDSFIQEVTEEVRQDQMLRYWKKYGAFVIGGVALIVAGAAAWNWSVSQEQAAAEARGAAFLSTDPVDTEAQMTLVSNIEGPANLVAELNAAAAFADSGDTKEATARYSAISGREGVAKVYRDIATLQQVRVAANTEGAAVSTTPLDALVTGGSAFRLLALELRGALKIANGDLEGGHADLNAVIADPLATGSLRQRAGALLTATGGTQEQPSG